MVNFAVSADDAKLIAAIVTRASRVEIVRGSRTDLAMDLAAVHANGTPLRLAELLKADAFNFIHDVAGIQTHIDRTTGALTDHFLPRYAQAQGSQR